MSTRRPPGMPHNPSSDYQSNLSLGSSEADHVLITAIQKAVSKSPAIIAMGANVTRSSAARLIFAAGIEALAERHGINTEDTVSSAQADYDAWYGADDNGTAADEWFAARA